MTTDTWRRLEEDYADVPEARGTGNPVTEEEIRETEATLGLTIPDDYREVLLRWGGTMVGSYPLYGLRPVEIMGNSWSLVERTQRYRATDWPGIGDWLVISTDGYGNPIGMDPQGRVLRSEHDGAFQITELAPSFEAFLRKYAFGLTD